MESLHIEVVAVNHNTSAFAELMLRSLFSTHVDTSGLAMTMLDNDSDDDVDVLRAYCAETGVAFAPSGWNRATRNNSHGDVLRRFVLEHPDCTHFLFLDSDVVFGQPDTIGTLLRELQAEPHTWGIGPRLSWDGVREMPAEISSGNPGIYEQRLHPCCALVPNTRLFRDVAREVGLGCARYLHPDREQYLDTFELLTMVLRTHGLHHARSSALVLHFFSASYTDDPNVIAHHTHERDRRLAELRAAAGGEGQSDRGDRR